MTHTHTAFVGPLELLIYPMRSKTLSLEIQKRIEIIIAECGYGIDLSKDLFTGMTDLIGDHSETTQKVLRDARKVVLTELCREVAAVLGQMRLVGVDLDSPGERSLCY